MLHLKIYDFWMVNWWCATNFIAFIIFTAVKAEKKKARNRIFDVLRLRRVALTSAEIWHQETVI